MTDLSSIEFDSSLVEGARNAVRTCLGIQPHENVVLLTGKTRIAVGAALAAEVRDVGAPLRAFVLGEHVERPATALPLEIVEAFHDSQVSIFACGALPGELRMRREMTAIVNARGMRHAHMVGITEQIMREGMRADFKRIERLTEWVRTRAKEAREIVCKTPAGTDLRAEFDPAIKWIPTPGIIRPEKWSNLPGGETFSSPARVDGVFVVDGVLGDWLAPKYGDMREHPLTITIENSRIVDLKCGRKDALADFREYTSTDENSDRVGEYALGTNVAVKDVIGNMLQDEKIPGVHIAFGHPYSEHTGATWSSTSHIDVVGRDFDVWLDGEQLMEKSRYLLDGAVV